MFHIDLIKVPIDRSSQKILLTGNNINLKHNAWQQGECIHEILSDFEVA